MIIFKNEQANEMKSFKYAFIDYRSLIRMLRDLLTTFSQTNSCEICERMPETYSRWIDVIIFKNEQANELKSFKYALRMLQDLLFHKLTAVKFVRGCQKHIPGGLM